MTGPECAGPCGRRNSDGRSHNTRTLFFLTPRQPNNPGLRIAEYPLERRPWTKPGESVCVQQALSRCHPVIMTDFSRASNTVSPCPACLSQPLRSNFYPLVWEKTQKLIEKIACGIPEGKEAKTLISQIKRFAFGLSQSPENRYALWMSHFAPGLKAEICTEEFKKGTETNESEKLFLDIFQCSDATDLLNATLDVDVNTYLPNDLLVKVDIATMAHGLEARSPFLDHKVMEFCAGLPATMKLKGSCKKYLLKKAAKEFLPSQILHRPKMGFGVPIDHWLRDELKDFAHDILLSSRSAQRGIVQPKVVERMLLEHVKKIRAWHYPIWNLLMLELWYRMFIDGDWKAEGRKVA